jgi:hypothetical protein
MLFDPLNSVITWKQIAARNVRLEMKETIHATVSVPTLTVTHPVTHLQSHSRGGASNPISLSSDNLLPPERFMSSSPPHLPFLFPPFSPKPPLSQPPFYSPHLGPSPRRRAMPLRSVQEGPPRPRFLAHLSPFLTRSESGVRHARAGSSIHRSISYLSTHPLIMKSESSPTGLLIPYQLYTGLEVRLRSTRVRICSASRSLSGQRPPLGEELRVGGPPLAPDSLSSAPPFRYLPRPPNLCNKRQL